MIHKTYLLLLIITGLGSVRAQSLPDTIPFILNRQNNLCIKARINYSDTVLLMFHSSATGLMITREALPRIPSLKTNQSTQVTTWGGLAETQVSEHNTLSVGRSHWDSLSVFIDENSGVGTDGKFGYDLFEDKVLAIDYDHSRIIIYPALPKLTKDYTRLKLIIKDGSTFIPGALKIGKTVYRDTFMFHSGYGGTVLLDPEIGAQYAMQSRLKTISTSQLQDAFGNVFKIETKLLPQLRVGSKKFKDVPLSFAVRPSAIPMKVFGNGLLKRFNVVFDFHNAAVYLKPNHFWGAAF